MTPHERRIAAIAPKLLKWFPKNARDLPWRREPYCKDPYCVYVSEIMLQQTQVRTVVPYWQRWMKALPNIEALAKARPGKIHKLWEGLGYYGRVRNLQRAAQVIVKEHGGKLPERFEELRALPGIGRYTAGAICSIAFNQPKPILDGNVIRVLCRLFGVEGDPRQKETNERLWGIAERLVLQARQAGGQANCSKFNQGLMELGALVCMARKPACELCPVSRQCTALGKGLVEALPRRPARVRASSRRFRTIVIQRRSQFLVRQRPAGTVNAYLWEFPNWEVPSGRNQSKERARSPIDFRPDLTNPTLKPLCTIKHSITRYRMTLEAFRADVSDSFHPRIDGFSWLTLAQMRRLAFASAHKKVLAHLS